MTTRHVVTRRRNTRAPGDGLPMANTRVRYGPAETVFAQGDRCAAVMYLHKGRVKLTATSRNGRQAVVGILRAGAFFGEGALAGQRRRKCSAESLTASTIFIVKTGEMRRGLHDDPALAERFRRYLLGRNIRIEADLVGQIFNRYEKRLARILLLLANFDTHQMQRAALPRISRNLLADMIGATRWKVDLLMNGFRKDGFLERHRECDGGVQVHRSMLNIVLAD